MLENQEKHRKLLTLISAFNNGHFPPFILIVQSDKKWQIHPSLSGPSPLLFPSSRRPPAQQILGLTKAESMICDFWDFRPSECTEKFNSSSSSELLHILFAWFDLPPFLITRVMWAVSLNSSSFLSFGTIEAERCFGLLKAGKIYIVETL